MKDKKIDKIIKWSIVSVFLFVILIVLAGNIENNQIKLNNIIERQDNIIDDLIYLREQDDDQRDRIEFMEERHLILLKQYSKLTHALIPPRLCNKECHVGRIGICEGCHYKGVRQ